MVEEIWEQLRTLILRGELAPGRRLFEMEIAATTGASQASVREALQRLETDGLVVRRGRSGTYVTDVSVDDMHEIFLARCTVESAAIRRTAGSITPPQLKELNTLVNRMRLAAETGDTASLVKHDMTFHRRICAWADHATLLRLWTLIESQMERFLIIRDPLDYVDLATVADNHLPIIEALETRNPDLATERIAAHVMLGDPRARSASPAGPEA